MMRASSRPTRFHALALVGGIALGVLSSTGVHADDLVDVVAYFKDTEDARGAGLARKTKPVDVRPAEPGEVVVTIIKGEGKETESPAASPGDMVVRNRCPETGDEEILVTAGKFPQRYEGPVGEPDGEGWSTYRPRGIEMRFVWSTRQTARSALSRRGARPWWHGPATRLCRI